MSRLSTNRTGKQTKGSGRKIDARKGNHEDKERREKETIKKYNVKFVNFDQVRKNMQF